MRLIDADVLDKTIREEFHGISATGFIYFMRDKTPIEVYNRVRDLIDNTPTVEPQKIVTIPPELIEKLALNVVDIVENIDWEKAIEAYKVRPQGEWIPVSERLPEGKINPKTNDFESVLCSTVWDDVRPYKFGKPIGHDKAHFWWGCGVMDDYVIAWMPLPEAYKEETENG